jgi:hypothetical protein
MCTGTLFIPLGIIFSESIRQDCVPKKFREGNMYPIFKKGSRLLTANYRHVSLTSIVCKLLEGIIRDRFMDFW